MKQDTKVPTSLLWCQEIQKNLRRKIALEFVLREIFEYDPDNKQLWQQRLQHHLDRLDLLHGQLTPAARPVHNGTQAEQGTQPHKFQNGESPQSFTGPQGHDNLTKETAMRGDEEE